MPLLPLTLLLVLFQVPPVPALILALHWYGLHQLVTGEREASGCGIGI